jgi:two-component sensor histidine kinase
VYNIGDTALLITTNNGLSHFNLNHLSFRNYYDGDGLHSNSFEEVAGARSNDLIYAGGVKGFTVINPKRFTTNTVSPTLYISNLNIKTTERVYDISKINLPSIKIPNTVLQTDIYFSALNYSSPARTIFSYRIREIDKNWISLGNQNFVTLIGLNPGKYTIEVKAANEDGFWSKAVKLELIFSPKWYQTWWFYLLIALLVALCIYGIYQFRINELKREQIIRRKIAIDLHDDLGSTLNSVNVYANLAIMEQGKDLHLLKIKESMQEAIVSLRDIIWVMDDKKNSFEHLVARISRFFSPLCEANGIRFKVDLSNEALYYKLDAEEKRNLYMVIKEALNNSLKYAEAKEVNIKILLVKNKPAIIIKDDGKGFNLSNTSMGNGLNNMKLRAGQIRYNIVIKSMPGTAIQLQKR